MNFMTVFESDLEFYFDHAFRPQDSLLVYLHVPKAAGNSSLHYLKQFKKNYFDIMWDDIDVSWNTFLEDHEKQPFDLVSGHFLDYHLKMLQDAEVPHHAISFVRHPIERIVSQYKYMCTPVHPGHEQFILEYPDFESFAFENVTPNYMGECLVGKVRSFSEYLDRAKDNYLFLGITEFYHTSMFALCRALGIPYRLRPRKNVTMKTDKNNITISRKTYKKLCELHSLDIQFYDFLYSRYAALADQLIAYQIESKLID